MPLEIRRLEPGDDRTKFRSGNADLDRFFVRYAGQNQFRHHIGITYIAADDRGWIAGFATVTASELSTVFADALKRKRRPRYPLPVLRLARLAVDESARGLGVGRSLLRFVLVLAQRMRHDIGCVGVVVDAKPDAASFYERLGFVFLDVGQGHLGDRPEPIPMFLEIGSVAT